MREDANNPQTNQLGNGITEEQLNSAVIKSGYPLQTKVALQLKNDFDVIEEWGFIDDVTGVGRSTDVLAERLLFNRSSPDIRPILDLIIECKQSELPYVFFLSEKQVTAKFPYLAGLPKDDIIIHTDTERSTWELSIPQVLGFRDDDFLSNPPHFCNKFSKSERKGPNLILSGEETFNGIIQPLLKAMSHLKRIKTPNRTAQYYNCHLIIGVAVLDAPMIGVEINNNGHELISAPWVRVVKHLPDELRAPFHNSNLYAIDVVHKDFLNTYTSNHVLPFGNRISLLMLKHHKVLAKGIGFIPKMDEINFLEIERHLMPMPEDSDDLLL